MPSKRSLDLRELHYFLKSDLVWSDDFENIREPLAALMFAIHHNLTVNEQDRLEPALTQLTNTILDDVSSIVISN